MQCVLLGVAGCVLLFTAAVKAELPAPLEPPASDLPILTTNNLEALSAAYLHLQQQVHAARLAVEESRQDAARTAAGNSESMAKQLRAIEQSLATQRAAEFQEIQRSNRFMLIVAGVFAGIGLLSLFGMAYFQWHTLTRLSSLSTLAAPLPALGAGQPFPRLAFGGTADLSTRDNGRWDSTLTQLEQRIAELEQATRLSLNAAGDTHLRAGTGPLPTQPGSDGTLNRVQTLLEKGQSLLSLGRPADALESFEEAALIEPDNANALVKQGIALEELERMDEALACYDRAIAADRSMPMAYLRKGGLCNRRQLFKEALECYEMALHTGTKQNS